MRRQYATAAAPAVAEEPLPYPHGAIKTLSSEPTGTEAKILKPVYQLHAGVLLSRPPFLTRELTPFEKSFYLYQRRLNERLSLPFTRYFYYQKGTPQDIEWKRKRKDRKTNAREIGLYDAYGKDSWNDELLVGAQESEPAWQVEQLVADAQEDHKKEQDLQVEGVQTQHKKRKQVVEKPMSRLSAADETGDVTSLNRMGWRTLYMLVKGDQGRWTFPSGRLLPEEHLYPVCAFMYALLVADQTQAAERVLAASAGTNMHTWIVGAAPVGHYVYNFRKILHNEETSAMELGQKVFFMKARIMAGQANLKSNSLGLTEFKWLTREEIEKTVSTQYWAQTRHMLAER